MYLGATDDVEDAAASTLYTLAFWLGNLVVDGVQGPSEGP